MNRRIFLTGLLCSTAAVPLARVVPVMPSGPFIYGVDFGGIDRTVVTLFMKRMDDCVVLMRRNLEQHVFAEGSRGGAFTDLLEDYSE